MPESMENLNEKTEPVYPEEKDLDELKRIADIKATGTNLHDVKNVMGTIILAYGLGKQYGWNEEKLKIYTERKNKLFEILSGQKIE